MDVCFARFRLTFSLLKFVRPRFAFSIVASRVRRFRKPWMSEDYRMSIFDAAVLAVTFSRLK